MKSESVKLLSGVQLLVTPWFLCLWDSPGKNTGMGCHSLLQGIFLTQGWNPGLLHYRQILYCLRHQGSPYVPLKTHQLKRILHEKFNKVIVKSLFYKHFLKCLSNHFKVDS